MLASSFPQGKERARQWGEPTKAKATVSHSNAAFGSASRCREGPDRNDCVGRAVRAETPFGNPDASAHGPHVHQGWSEKPLATNTDALGSLRQCFSLRTGHTHRSRKSGFLSKRFIRRRCVLCLLLTRRMKPPPSLWTTSMTKSYTSLLSHLFAHLCHISCLHSH